MLRHLFCLIGLCYAVAFGHAGTYTVHMFNFDFTTDPNHVKIIDPVIHVGDTIRWINDSGIHCSNSCAGLSETWSSGVISNIGGTYDHTFTHAGVFQYYCCIHGFDNGNGTAGGMSGKITVLPKPVNIKPTPGGLLVDSHGGHLRPGIVTVRRIANGAVTSAVIQALTAMAILPRSAPSAKNQATILEMHAPTSAGGVTCSCKSKDRKD